MHLALHIFYNLLLLALPRIMSGAVVVFQSLHRMLVRAHSGGCGMGVPSL